MTKRPRRNHIAAFKAKVALAALKGAKTLTDLAQDRADSVCLTSFPPKKSGFPPSCFRWRAPGGGSNEGTA
jgi:hypothetical protein